MQQEPANWSWLLQHSKQLWSRCMCRGP